MAIRIGGMYSGLDTDAIVQEFTSAYSEKKNNIIKQQEALKWKKEQWTEMNTAIYDFYAKDLSNMRFNKNDTFNTSYSDDEKSVSIVNPTKKNIGIHSIQVEQLAQSGYLTGKQLDDEINNDTKISSIVDRPIDGNQIRVNGNIIEVTDTMTVGELAAEIAKIENINANYDESNNRFFINSTKTGVENDINISAEDDETSQEILKKLGLAGGGETQIHGQDAKILFNGVEYDNSSNDFSINGLSIKAKNISQSPVNVTIQQGNSETFDNISNFVTAFNGILEKMQTAYNKPSSKTYMPLSEDEKEAMSDKEIEKWEKAGKGNILSKDSSLNSVMNILKTDSAKSYEIDGKKYTLASIGITTSPYLSTTKDKRGTLTIDEDKLKKMIDEDPELVNNIVKAVSTELYENLGKNSKSSSLKSAYNFYNDKEIEKEIKNHQSNIDAWEKKITKMQDRYYKQFSAMETMIAKMQSQSSALTNMFNF